MSLNLGNDGVEAARALGQNPEWRKIRHSLYGLMAKHFNDALDRATPEAMGYSRALRDVYVAFEAATHGKHQNSVEPAAPHSGPADPPPPVTAPPPAQPQARHVHNGGRS